MKNINKEIWELCSSLFHKDREPQGGLEIIQDSAMSYRIYGSVESGALDVVALTSKIFIGEGYEYGLSTPRKANGETRIADADKVLELLRRLNAEKHLQPLYYEMYGDSLIIRFMGGRIEERETTSGDSNTLVVFDAGNKYTPGHISREFAVPLDAIHYRTNIGWLWPVAHKAVNTFHDKRGDIFSALNKVNKEELYKALVVFIDWCNQNQKEVKEWQSSEHFNPSKFS